MQRSPVGEDQAVIRHLLAPHVPQAAASLRLPERLDDLPGGGPERAPGRRAGSAGVALTFDDGPHPSGTPAILEILARHDARATFFLVGEQVRRHPGIAGEITARGHAVAVHADRHRLQLRLGARTLADDLDRACESIAGATGITPRLHRPPYGLYSRAGLAAARARGLQPLLWSRWGKDWRRLTTPARIARRATANLRAGDVILLHDADHYSARNSHERTAAALPVILGELSRRELDTVLVV